MEQRLQWIRDQLAQGNYDAMLVTSPINRKYITGFTGSSGFALITQQAKYLITDGRYITQSKEQAPDWEFVLHYDLIMEKVGQICHELGVTSLCFEAEHMTFQEYTDLQSFSSPVRLIPTVEWVEKLRIEKNTEEIKQIREAAAIVDKTFARVVQELKPGMTEKQVALRIDFLMREFGATGSAFETIVASGKRSALPHGLASDKVLEKGDFVLMDFGARYQGYTSDISRTLVLGKANEKQREIYTIVQEALTRTIAAAKPGMTGKKVDAVAREWITQQGYGDFFNHATGHGIGLDVHEPPVLRRTSEEVLKAGMVVTVEPGIYLPDMGGVRIEDDILLTESGCERLTRAPQSLMELNCD